MQKVKKERRYAIMIFNTLLKPNLQKIFDDLNLYITSLENQLEFYKKIIKRKQRIKKEIRKTK